MRINRKMIELLTEYPIDDLTEADIPPMFLEVVREGWSYTPNGARVLRGLLPISTASYGDLLQEETSINGRGMVDYDLPRNPAERNNILLRRCFAYAFSCLDRASEEFNDKDVRGYVSLSMGGVHDDVMTANVTFCTPNPNSPPYISNLESVSNEAIAELSVDDRP
jgi:hypothetical protein